MTNPVKQADPDHPIHELFARRWSPYAFRPEPVDRPKLLACLEAARWAPSSFNEQPWSFLVAERTDEEAFNRMLGCLVEVNQQWARNAGVLLISVVQRRFAGSGNPNRVAEHDLGIAAAHLTLQATALGLHVHQMAGIDIEAARETYAVPDGHDPMTGLALGTAASPEEAVDPKFARRDQRGRSRQPLADFVFGDRWGTTAPAVRAE